MGLKKLKAISLFVALFIVASAAQGLEAGFKLEAFVDAERDRPISIDLWYPTLADAVGTYHYGLGTGRAIEAADIAPGKFPLIMLSHGALGAPRNYSWIAEALARRGYVVAGVAHFGESYVFGPETVDARAVLRSWERPVDVSAAIDFMLTRSTLAESIITQQIGFVGHSSGGATGLYLAGVQFEYQKMTDYCNSAQAAGDRGCDYAQKVTLDLDKIVTGGNYQDERISVFTILDPALGPGFTNFSAIDATILIVGSVENDFLPFEHHAQLVANKLPMVTTHWLKEGAGHFVYLNQCQRNVTANGVPLCIDQPSVSRENVHINLKKHIGEFIDSGFTQ